MKKKSLVLMTSIALILLMTLSVIAFSWPWQATGDATFVGPYKIYKEKPRDIKVGNNKYDIRVKEVKDSNTATLSIAGIDKNVIEGETYTIGNLQIKVIAIGSWVGKYVKFSVAEVEGITNVGDIGKLSEEEKIIKINEILNVGLNKLNVQKVQFKSPPGVKDYNADILLTKNLINVWHGYTWDCIESITNNGELASATLLPSPNFATAGLPYEAVNKCYDEELKRNYLYESGYYCRCKETIQPHPCTQQKEFVKECDVANTVSVGVSVTGTLNGFPVSNVGISTIR